MGIFCNTTKDGKIINVEVYCRPITLDVNTYKSISVIDVTDKVEGERKLAQAIIRTQDQERFEIGAELHDNICQILVATALGFEAIKFPEGQLEESARLKGLFNLNNAINEIRNLSHRLAPAFFNNISLNDAVFKLLETYKGLYKSEFNIIIDESFQEKIINKDILLNIYRILQEQLSNIHKYANARAIDLAIWDHNDCIHITIKDDGIGFDTSIAKGGIGLSNMKRRVERFSGTISINSSPGNGCQIFISIPYIDETIHN